MKIACTFEEGQIFQHFGHSSQFKVYEVENDKVVAATVEDTNGSGHGALAGFLQELGVDVLICGGIGGGAIQALKEAKIQVFGGVSGDADSAVASFLNHQLQYNPDVQCNHHNQEHGEGHSCGEHGCGSSHCGH